MYGTAFNGPCVHSENYCSQREPQLPVLSDIRGDAVIKIGKIFQKKILCYHDVQDLDRIYQTIVQLEKKSDKIPELNSPSSSKGIIRKIGKIFLQKEVSIENLISLYHLQGFSEQELRIDECFKKKFIQFKMTPEQMRDLAIHLPCCISEGKFDDDSIALLGGRSDLDEEIIEILDRKKRVLQQVRERKLQLVEMKREDPLNYPPYFDELLDNGYVDLYDHLLEMRACSFPRDRNEKITKMGFSKISRVVLQLREAIIRKVESSIPSDCHRSVLFLLGITGAGKSTTLSFLREDPMVKIGRNNYESSSKPGIIGHEETSSCTLLPLIERIGDLVVVDYSGFFDTNSLLINLGAECALKTLIERYDPALLVLHPITDEVGKYKGARDVQELLNRLVGQNMKGCIAGITKYSHTQEDPKIENKKNKIVMGIKEETNLVEASEKLKGKIEKLEREVEKLNLEVDYFFKNPEKLSQHEELERFHKVMNDKWEKTGELGTKKITLEKMKQALEQVRKKLLSDEATLAVNEQYLEEQEKTLLGVLGLKNYIRFSNLENRDHRIECLSTLSKFKLESGYGSHPTKVLSAEHEILLRKQLWKFYLAVEKESGQIVMKNPREVRKLTKKCDRNFDDLKMSVLESSLTKTIFSNSHPEIGQLLHSPEIDPEIVRDFDKDIVSICIEKCIETEVIKLSLDVLDHVRRQLGNEKIENKAIEEKFEKCLKQQCKIQEYIMNFYGLWVMKKRKKTEDSWREIQDKHREAVERIKNTGIWPRLPFWFETALPNDVTEADSLERLLPSSRVPISAGAVEGSLEATVIEEMSELIDVYSKGLDKGHRALLHLIELQQLILQIKKATN